MSHRFSISDPALLEQHTAAYLIVSEVLRAQSQPIHVAGGDKSSLVFDLKVNLQAQQAERLILKEIRDSLKGYSCAVDWNNRKLVVKRANQTKRRKPAEPSQAASG